jgi:hypothetical protein
VQRVMPRADLMRQFRIAELDRPLFDVEAKLPRPSSATTPMLMRWMV